MSKEELAKRIKDRLVEIRTALEHMESIIKYSQNNKGFEDAFVMLYVSLQNYVYIELDKIFDGSSQHEFLEYDDTGKCIYHSSKYSIYKLIENKNGELIWEGDIILFQRDSDDCPFPNKDTKKRLGKVFYSDFRATFAIGMGKNGSESLNDDLWKYVQNGNRVEVIGNIFDNPELLKV